MGSGIATALILNGIPVVLKELNKDFLQAGLDRIRGSYVFSLRLFCIKIEEKLSSNLSRRRMIKPSELYHIFSIYLYASLQN